MLRTTLAAGLLMAGAAQAEPFTVVAYGDVPYGEPAEVYPPFEALIEAINARDPRLAIHVGDTKSGGTPCSDEILAEQLAYLNQVQAPVLYTPGDNEWTDCHREAAGGFDPLERLAHIRETYFAEPGTSFGAEPMEVVSQGGATPENVRVRVGDVLFVTAHVVGSNNNFQTRDMAAVEEFMARDAASTAWLEEGFREAGDASAVVVAVHADMLGEGFDAERGSWPGHSGFAGFGEALKEQAAAFGRPVLLIYGDSHVFTQSRPFPVEAPNLMALEVPGADAMHAVEIAVDPESAGVFAVSLLENPALSN